VVILGCILRTYIYVFLALWTTFLSTTKVEIGDILVFFLLRDYMG